MTPGAAVAPGSWALGSVERSRVPARGCGRRFGTPLGAPGAVVCATHSLGLQIDLTEAADTVLICTDGFNSSCGPWQEGCTLVLLCPSRCPWLYPNPRTQVFCHHRTSERRESFCVCTQDPHPALCPVTQPRNSLCLPPSSPKIVKSLLPWLGVVVSKALRVYVCTKFCSSLWH